jgi:hypothetical protein
MLADKGNHSPSLSSYAEYARRIKWVHGNMCVPNIFCLLAFFFFLTNPSYIRLDRLPFRSSSFDFVRISGIGLAVPEDEV